MNIFLTASVPRLGLTILGFVPIGSLCMALFQLVPLHTTLLVLVLPSLALASVIAMRHPTLALEAGLGLIAGMAATGLYDLVRFGLIVAGMWQDFIPSIGQMALNTPDASPLWGYLWRYLGNGGAMGMTFMLLGRRGAGTGMLYGTAICCCLFGTLLLAPQAQVLLFRLTPLSTLGALGGHLVYGAVLGALTRLMDAALRPHPSSLGAWGVTDTGGSVAKGESGCDGGNPGPGVDRSSQSGGAHALHHGPRSPLGPCADRHARDNGPGHPALPLSASPRCQEKCSARLWPPRVRAGGQTPAHRHASQCTTVLRALKKQEAALEVVPTAVWRTLSPLEVAWDLEHAGAAERDERGAKC